MAPPKLCDLLPFLLCVLVNNGGLVQQDLEATFLPLHDELVSILHILKDEIRIDRRRGPVQEVDCDIGLEGLAGCGIGLQGEDELVVGGTLLRAQNSCKRTRCRLLLLLRIMKAHYVLERPRLSLLALLSWRFIGELEL